MDPEVQEESVRLDSSPIVQILRQELNIFTASKSSGFSVFVVPPCLTSYTRLQLHTLVQREFSPDFKATSFGVGKHRCCVVYRDCHGSIEGDENNKDPEAESSVEATRQSIRKTFGAGVIIVHPLTPESSLADAQDGCVTGSAGVSHNVSDDARQLGHIVELWGFASTVKTRDLDAVLHLFRTKQYYELVWVDDNHALAVMNDSPSAKAAINYINNHAPPHSVHNIHAVQIRPFAQASPQSKSKARAIGLCAVASLSDAAKPRPKTSMVTANRLLSRALGLPPSQKNANAAGRRERN